VVLQFLKKRLILFRNGWPGVCAVALWTILLCPLDLFAGEIAIIVNENGPLTHISKEDVREIYLGERRFVEGVRIVPIHCPEGPIKDNFLSSIIGRTSKAYKLHWVRKVFQEGLTLPEVKADPSEIIELVSKQEGAIGYVPRGLVSEDRGVRIIDIIEIVKP
jgi:ABC-type phosphate transport system substrate-binding protein